MEPMHAQTWQAAAVTGTLLGVLAVAPSSSAAGPVAASALPAASVAPAAPASPVAAGSGEKRLREALLDAVDFPLGWASDSRRAAQRRGIGVPDPAESACRGLFDGDRGATAVRAGFARTTTGPFVTTVVTGHAGPADARRAMKSFREAARQCGTFHAEEGPPGRSVTVAYDAGEPGELADLPALRSLGDDSTAVRFNRRLAGHATTPVVVDVVIARVGSHVVRVAQAGRDDLGTGSVSAIAERAVDKLRQVARGTTPYPEPDQPGTTEL